MSDNQKYGEAESTYERLECKYKCGLSKYWKQTCWQGPDANGQCGGVIECNPLRRGDRYYCSRPQRAGGSCKDGPLPDGGCAHTRVACIPVFSMRNIRGQFSLIIGFVVIATIILFTNIGDVEKVGGILMDPGSLSGVHSVYTRGKGCVSCHDKHDDDLISWFGAAFITNDDSNNCLNCHSFNEPQLGPHNFIFKGEYSKITVSCASCHKEHRGENEALTNVTKKTCANCHKKNFDSFEKGHPDFQKKFPSSIPNSINFDHLKHLKEYFIEPQWVDKENRDSKFSKLASEKCTTCHAIEKNAGNEIKPKSFDQICKNCHIHQIRDRDLIILTSESYTALSSLFLGVAEEDVDDDEAENEHGDMIASLSANPDKVLISFLNRIGVSDKYFQLFSGLSPILLKEAASSWVNEKEFIMSTNSGIEHYGWLAGEDENLEESFRYKSLNHADPIMKVWFEVLLLLESNKTVSEVKNVRNYLLDSQEGPGACAKCHSTGLTDELIKDQQNMTWRYRGNVERIFTSYSHGPHINLLEPSKNCINCHKLDSNIDYAKYFKLSDKKNRDFISNFTPITKDNCTICHQIGKVSTNCIVCHKYHNEAMNKKVFQETGIISHQPEAIKNSGD